MFCVLIDDVILGGGAKHFKPMAEGENLSVESLARRNGFAVLKSARELAAAEPPKRILGLFSASTMPVRLQGEDGREAEDALCRHMQRVSVGLDIVLADGGARLERRDGHPVVAQR